MVQFGELCAWEMPEVAGTWMRDVGKIRTGGQCVCRTSRDSKKGGLVGASDAQQVSLGTWFGFQLFLVQCSSSMAVELFWNSVFSSVKWSYYVTKSS